MSWLTKLFYKKKNANEVREWLALALSEQQKREGDAETEFKRELNSAITEWKRALSELETAELHNPNIPERARHFMEGNRRQFVALSSKAIDDAAEIKTADDIRALLNQYANDTARCRTILSEFFREEVKKVLGCAAAIESAHAALAKVRSDGADILLVRDALASLDELSKESLRRSELLETLRAKEAAIRSDLDLARQKKESLVQGKDYLDVKEKLIAAAKERIAASDEISSIFSPLSDAIQKFVHAKNDKKLEKYTTDPLDALIHDYALTIVERAPLIRQSIESGEIVLVDDKRSKALAALPLLTKETLSKLIHRYANARKEEMQAQNAAAVLPVMKEFESAVAKMGVLKGEREQCEQEMARCAPPNAGSARDSLAKSLDKFKIELA